MLSTEIEKAQRLVKTDAYQMSIGEIVTMYDDKEIIVDPEFQRLFRWDVSQKSKLIESLLLGIPIPSIFVFEKEDGTWELIDGLQRISTILEFMGRLRNPDGGMQKASVLVATKYLPSLHNAVWEATKNIGIAIADQRPIDKSLQLAIRRSRLAVEILKRPSEDQTKFDLFQRLNAGGTQANAQELRNCIMLMINGKFFRAVKFSAELEAFRIVTALSDDQTAKQRHLEMATRFLVHVSCPYDGKLDVQEYIDQGIVQLAQIGDAKGASQVIDQTFALLNDVAGDKGLRRFENGKHVGRVGFVGLEGIAVGIAKNLEAIAGLGEKKSKTFVKDKIKSFWAQTAAIESFTQPGLTGTVRIQRTVPFGEAWFRP